MFNKKGYIVVVILSLGLLITSCSSSPKVETMSDSNTETEVISGDGGVDALYYKLLQGTLHFVKGLFAGFGAHY